jgi:outer membrane receptor for ferrienterochelin and colicin
MPFRKVVFLLIFSLFLSSAFAQMGMIKGRVSDVKTNEPIEFCTVTVQGTTTGSITDSAGHFMLLGVPPGFVRVMAASVGFEPSVSSEVQVIGNQTVFVDITMVEQAQELKEVTVSRAFNLKKIDSPVSLLTIGVQDIEKSAGVNRDVSKVVQTLPGVGATDPQRNDLIVRGGGPSENVFYIDGVEIPVINHFATQGSSGGVVGVINPDFVREINFYTGAFPANRGNALSSVMDIRQRDGSLDRIHTSVTVGASDAGATVDGPMNEKTSFIFSVRQSYLQFLFKFLGLPFLPTYTDFQFKTKTQLNTRNELTFIGLGVIDDMVLNKNIAHPTESQRYLLAYLPIYKQWNYTMGAVYKHYSDRYFDTWVLSRNMLSNRNFKYEDNDESKPKTQDYRSSEAENKLRFERSYPDLPIRVLFGAGVKHAHYTNETTRRILVSDVATALHYSSDLNLLAYQIFMQASDDYLDQLLNLSFGLRFSGNDYNRNMANPLNQLSPRLSASYRLSEKWTVNANVGRFVMEPSYTSLGYRNTAGILVNQNEKVHVTGANEAVFGVEFLPAEKVRMTVEGFYKAYDHYALSVADGISLASKGTEYGQVGDEEIVSKGKGRAYGLEFLFRVIEWKRANVAVTYTLFRSEFTDVAGTYRPSAWDTRHLLNLLGSVKFNKGWNISARWRYVGAAPYTPINEDLSSQVSVWDIRNLPYLDYSRYNDLRLKASHILDLRIDKDFYFRAWMLGLYADVQNVYNFQSERVPIYTNLDADGVKMYNTSDPSRYELRRLKDVGGSILPTVGIMVKL